MPMVRAMRLLNSIEAGTTNAAQLQTLLGDPGRLSEFFVLCGMRGQAVRIASSPTTMNAIAGSALARSAVGVGSSSVAYSVISKNSMAIGKLVAGEAGLSPAAYADAAAIARTPAAMTSVTGSGSAVMLLAASSIAVAEVDAVADARAKFYGAPTGGGYLGCIHTAGVRYAVIQAPKSTGETAGVAWKTIGEASSDTSDNDFGLLNANAQSNASHPLFLWARGLSIGGYTDWAPPAYNVIRALVSKHRQAVAENALFKAGGAQAYEASSGPQYWSATQNSSSPTLAWVSSFSDGTTASFSKPTTYRARVVRMVKL